MSAPRCYKLTRTFKRHATVRSACIVKTLLICHDGDLLDQQGMARWLASFSNLVGMVVLRETQRRIWRRIRRELKRSGLLRFADVLAFRLYYSLALSAQDQKWQARELERLCRIYPPLPKVPVLHSHSPNTSEAEQFIRKHDPDVMVARCKTLLKENIFSIPARGTFVLHPGICPEYRNAHGCFWALTNRDLDKVGMTLLRINPGVDTGPIYGHFGYAFDEVRESHFVIQNRVVFDNLEKLQNKFLEINDGKAIPLDTSDRPSATWGQPWFTSYLKWKYQARKRRARG